MIKLLITGPARSGTSFLAKFISEMGYPTGGEWFDDHNYGMEHTVAGNVNALLLKGFREGFNLTEKGKKELSEKVKSIENKVIKQPRFTTHPRILEFWRECVPGIKILYTIRKLENCQESVKRMGKKPIYTLEELKVQQYDFITSVMEMSIPCRMLIFPRFLDQYYKVYKYFKELEIEFGYQEGLNTWNRLVDHNKVHFR